MADLNELLVMQLDPIEASTVWTGRFNQYEGIRISPNDPGEYLWYPGTLETWGPSRQQPELTCTGWTRTTRRG